MSSTSARPDSGGNDRGHRADVAAATAPVEESQSSYRGKIVLATVKGDVHDIGKNIVGVVLRCNNFEVIDLGVMIPCDKILDTALAQKADIVGLSGLITPSLDEMVTVAKEMQRRGMTIPLLIGGATTSSKHTAVKIAPHYAEPVVHVIDASSRSRRRAVARSETKPAYVQEVRDDQESDRARFAQRAEQALVPYAEAFQRRFQTDWQTVDIARPRFTGTRQIASLDLNILRPYVDWSPFFQTWELKGKFPKIFDDAVVGAEARKAVRRCQPASRPDHRAEAPHGPGRLWLLAGADPRRRHRARRRRRHRHVPDAAAAVGAAGAEGLSVAGGLHRARRSRGRPITSARSRSRPAMVATSSSRSSTRIMTSTTRS